MNFFRVPVNIRETDAAYALEVVAPGLKKEDFQVNMTREMLTVSFEHQEENKEEDERQARPSTKKLRFSKCFTARHGRQTAAFFIPRRLQER